MDEKDIQQSTHSEETDETTEMNQENTEFLQQDTSENNKREDLNGETVSKSEYDTLKKEFDELDNRFIRLQAELQNVQKRHKREREAAAKYRSQDLAKEILPSIDNLERALKIEVEDEAGNNLKKGIEMVLESITMALKKEGIEVIEADGKPFDPNYHEAYTSLPAKEGQESGEVAEVFERGYILRDRVLRPAKVAVVQ